MPAAGGVPRSDPNKGNIKSKSERRRERREAKQWEEFCEMSDPMANMGSLNALNGMGSNAGMLGANPALYDAETPLTMPSLPSDQPRDAAPRGVPQLNMANLGGGEPAQ